MRLIRAPPGLKRTKSKERKNNKILTKEIHAYENVRAEEYSRRRYGLNNLWTRRKIITILLGDN